MVYGSSNVVETDDGTPVENLFGFYKLANTKHGSVYVQMYPGYFEDPRVIYPSPGGVWRIIPHSLFLDFDTFQQNYIDNTSNAWFVLVRAGVSLRLFCSVINQNF